MKVLHIGIAYYPALAYGGPLRSIRNIAEGLLRLGHGTLVCATDSDGRYNTGIECGTVLDIDGVSAIFFHSPLFRFYGYAPSMRRWLKKNLRSFDLVHIHGIFSFPQIYAGKLCRRHSVPFIVSPRGSSDIRVVYKRLRLFKKLYINLFQRSFFRQASLIHYTTTAERDNSLLKRLNIRHCIVPNAVHFPEESEGCCDWGEYILFVGRINWKKNLDLLIRAFASLPEIYSNYKLVLVGPDAEGVGVELKRLAAKLDIGERVIFTGMKNDEALAGIYSGARLFVLPSVSENFGHSLVEAMACGVPVVATSGVDAVTIPPVGTIAEVCDPQLSDLTDAMARVLDRYDDFLDRARHGVPVIKELFSPKQVVSEMADYYEEAARVKQN